MIAATITNQMNAISALVLASSPSIAPPPVAKPDTLKGIDDLIRAGFEAYRATCFNWLLVATGLVVVGLVFEGPELWHEITSIASRWHFRRKFHFSLPEEHAHDWAKLLAFVGWLLIVAGVAGEYVADSFVSKADGYVQTFDETALTDAQRQTSLAGERAGAAYERAATTEREAAQENERAANAERQAQSENARAAKALEAAETARKEAEGFQLQIAQANERAANAERETARLTGQLADRTLTDEQVISIAGKLSNFIGQPYTITAYWDSKESVGIANRIHRALLLARWSYSTEGGKSMLLGGVIGVFVDIHPDADETAKKAADSLVAALTAEGIETTLQKNNPKNPKTNMIGLTVGSKR
jgi:hypothetical protein